MSAVEFQPVVDEKNQQLLLYFALLNVLSDGGRGIFFEPFFIQRG